MPNPPKEFVDGFASFPGGMNSGVAPIALKKTQYAWGENTTCRGLYLTHRPPFRKQTLLLDDGIDLTGLRFQGACFYKPDFGAESIMAQIGGRLFQFTPDADRSARVYDRTIKDYFNGNSFSTQTVPTSANYNIIAKNLNDSSGAQYPTGTVIKNDPTYLTSSVSPVTVAPVIQSKGRASYTVEFPYESSFDVSTIHVHQLLYLKDTSVKWRVIHTNHTVGGFATITLQYTYPSSQGNLTFGAGTPLSLINSPFPINQVSVTSSDFTAPATGQSVRISISSPYAGSVNDAVFINGFIYTIQSIENKPSQSSSVQVQSAANGSLEFSYDLNPAGALQAWLWQSENYVIVQDGDSRPVIYNGISSRRSLAQTFIGKNSESFVVPRIGSLVDISLDSKFQDGVGAFIEVSPVDSYSFLMEIVAIKSDTVVTASNVTGLVQVGSIVPIGTTIVSSNRPKYFGVTTAEVVAPGTVQPALFQVTPPYTEAFDNYVRADFLNVSVSTTDGSGPVTKNSFTISGSGYGEAVFSGGSSFFALNNSAPENTIIPAGTPIISDDAFSSEIPVGRMGAYVQGRNWISMPDGKSFIASDLVGSSNGTQSLDFRDAVLKWSQNTTQFAIPGGAGQINAIVALNALDASLGQGPLQILCDNDIFTCSAGSDATLWPTATSPIISETVIGFGGVGQDAATPVNGDLIFKSNDGSIHSLKLSRQDFNQWGNLPISQEVNRVVEQENLNLISKVTIGNVSNRALISCAPINSDGGIYSQGLMAIDYDVTSSLQGKLPSVYDGVWKGGNFLKIVSGTFNKEYRAFAFLWNETTKQVELWEILGEGTADDDGTGTPLSIPWLFESPVIFNDLKSKGEFDLVQLKSGEIYFSDLVGEASFKIYYRSDFSKCWHLWHKFTVQNSRPEPSYVMRAGLGEPTPSELSDALISTPSNVARFYQIRIEITGSLVFQGAKFVAASFPENIPPQVFCD